ncbi:MAG TPA: hypothetical protein DD381_03615 [Lentisphaeria bacterium]|nr:MAG: hypothetical protein A2X47_09225 [Lentisphaerae bacterium GWF2_38_69]HBM15420.1 hypothetical protein [Lentisphaeria bacterium]
MKFRHFNELTTADTHSDFHIHSNYTDGKGSIADIVKRAEEIGLTAIAITDHIREDSTYFFKYSSEIEDIRQKTQIDVLIGFESRIKSFNGELDVDRTVATEAEIKIGSVHRFSIGEQLRDPASFVKDVAQGLELEISLAGIAKGDFHILGHPGGMSLTHFKEFPLRYFEKIIIACKKSNIAFELNSAYHQDVYSELKNILKKHNPLVIFGSDAHMVEDIGRWLFLLKDI